MRLKILILSIFVAFLLVGGSTTFVCAKIESNYKIIVVHSYHKQYAWTSIISRGIKRTLEAYPNIELETVYLDTKRNTSEKWKNTQGKRVRKVINLWKPDVLIAVDDNAQQYVAKYYLNKAKPAIVFCGVNNNPKDYGYIEKDNVTGMVEKLFLNKTIRLFQKINPKAKNFAVMTDDSITSTGALKHMRAEVAESNINIVAYAQPKTFSDWKTTAKELSKKTDAIIVYTYHTVKNDEGTAVIDSKKIIKWMRHNINTPVLGLLSFSVDDGVMGGVFEATIEHGENSAKMALDILKGQDVKQMPFLEASKSVSAFNISQIKERGFLVDQSLETEIDLLIGD